MIRWHSANGLVRSVPIVEVDVFGESRSGLRDAVVCTEIHLLVLDRFPQTLDKHIVTPAAFATHRYSNVAVCQDGDEGQLVN